MFGKKTNYAGVTFRSELEARWAMFFDLMKIEWKYEPEWFWITEYRYKYKPDFFLPKLNMFAEVKPLGVGSIKAMMLAQRGGKNVIILDGEPDTRTYQLIRKNSNGWPECLPVAFLGDYLLGGWQKGKEYRLYENHGLIEFRDFGDVADIISKVRAEVFA